MNAKLNQEEMKRYSRHIMIPEVGEDGQRKLKEASVLVVGVGGLGSPIALYLAAAGIGYIGMVDPDVVEESNLQRQVIHSMNWLGKPKVESAKEVMHSINPKVDINAINDRFTYKNAISIAEDFDILIDGTDNLASRYLLSDLSVFTGKPYVYGSIFQFEGQVSVFGYEHGPCYRCLFPKPPVPGSIPLSNEVGVFGVLPGVIGSLEATEAIKLILGIGNTLSGKLLLLDALDMSFQLIAVDKNPKCEVCGIDPKIDALIDYDAFCETI